MPRQEILNIYVDKQKIASREAIFMCNVCDVLTIHGPEQRGRNENEERHRKSLNVPYIYYA